MTETAPARRMFRHVVPIDDKAHLFRLTGSPVAVAVNGARSVEFWAEDDESQPDTRRAFRVYGTGHPLPEGATWAGTCPRSPEGFVWHLFELPLPKEDG